MNSRISSQTNASEEKYELPQWAPRLSKAKIAQLYVTNAKGIIDDELIDEVGIGLLARCESILIATEAAKGRLPCPKCGDIIHHRQGVSHKGGTKKILQCEKCNWQAPWSAYIRTYRGKQLSAGGMAPFFREFVKQYPKVKTSREKMVLIDTLIHRFHHELENRFGRIGAVNLIQGQMTDVINFLHNLTYSEHSLPETSRNLRLWLDAREAQKKRRKEKQKS